MRDIQILLDEAVEQKQDGIPNGLPVENDEFYALMEDGGVLVSEGEEETDNSFIYRLDYQQTRFKTITTQEVNFRKKARG